MHFEVHTHEKCCNKTNSLNNEDLNYLKTENNSNCNESNETNENAFSHKRNHSPDHNHNHKISKSDHNNGNHHCTNHKKHKHDHQRKTDCTKINIENNSNESENICLREPTLIKNNHQHEGK